MQTRSTKSLAIIGGALASLGGLASAWFLWVYSQGTYHLFSRFGMNEYIEPEDGVVYLDAGFLPCAVLGILIGLIVWGQLVWWSGRKSGNPEALLRWLWLGLPLTTLLLQPLLGLCGIPASLVPIFHGILAAGLTAGLIANGFIPTLPEGKRHQRVCAVVLIVLMVIHFGLFAFLNICQFRALNLGYFDSGQIAEGYHQTFRGKFMMTYNQPHRGAGKGTSMDHLFCTRILALPIFWLFPYHETILVIHALALCLGAWPVFLLGRRVLEGSYLGLGFAIVYLIYTPVLFLEFRSSYGPSEEAQAISMFLAAFYYLSVSRPGLCLFWALAAMAVKENMAPTAAMIGVWMTMFTPHKKWGAGLFAGALVYFIVGTKLILPLVNDRAYGFVVSYFSDIGDGYGSILWRVISDPLFVISYVCDYRNLSFILHLIVPLGMLSLFSPSRLAIMLPSLFFLLISNMPTHHTILFWNHASLVPILIFSAVFGASRVQELLKKHAPYLSVQIAGLVVSLLMCAGLSAWLFFIRMQSSANFDINQRHLLVKEVRELVPIDTSVLVTYRLSGHFTENLVLNCTREYYPGEHPDGKVLPLDQEFVVLDPYDRWAWKEYYKTTRTRDYVLRDSNYGLVYERGQFYVFRRGAPREDHWKGIKLDFKPSMEVKVGQIQKGGARLMGWNQPRRINQTTLFVETFWECIAPMDAEYEVALSFRLPGGEIISTRHLMANWLYPTTIWEAGDFIRDVRRIRFAEGIPREFKLGVTLVEPNPFSTQ